MAAWWRDLRQFAYSDYLAIRLRCQRGRTFQFRARDRPWRLASLTPNSSSTTKLVALSSIQPSKGAPQARARSSRGKLSSSEAGFSASALSRGT